MKHGLRNPVKLPLFTMLMPLLDYIFDADINLYALTPPLLALFIQIMLRPRIDLIPLALTLSVIAAAVKLDGVDLATYSILIIVYAVLPHLETGWAQLTIHKARQLLIVALVVASPIPLTLYYNYLITGAKYPIYAVMLAATTALYLLILQVLSPDPTWPAIIGDKLAVNPHDMPARLRYLAKLVLGITAAITLNKNPLSLPILLLVPVVHLLFHTNDKLERPIIIVLATALFAAELAT